MITQITSTVPRIFMKPPIIPGDRHDRPDRRIGRGALRPPAGPRSYHLFRRINPDTASWAVNCRAAAVGREMSYNTHHASGGAAAAAIAWPACPAAFGWAG